MGRVHSFLFGCALLSMLGVSRLLAADEPLEATGTVLPMETVEIGARTAGVVTEVMVDVNSKVQQGEVLAKLDPRESELKLARARAKLQSAEATLQVAKAKLNAADADANRATKLLENNAIDRASFEALRTAAETAKANLALEESNLLIAKIDYEAVQLELDACVIRAPRAGVILERRCTVGGQVAPGSGAAAGVFLLASDPDKLQIHTNVSEEAVAHIKVGQAVQFKVAALPDKEFKGQVRLIRYLPAKKSKFSSCRVEIDIDNSDHLLVPYMTAEVRVITK